MVESARKKGGKRREVGNFIILDYDIIEFSHDPKWLANTGTS